MENSPTALFDSYESDFQQLIQSVRTKLDGSGSSSGGEFVGVLLLCPVLTG